jgi:hypothetical protein
MYEIVLWRLKCSIVSLYLPMDLFNIWSANKIYIFSLFLIFLCCNEIIAQNQVYAEDSLKYGSGRVYMKMDKLASFPGGWEKMGEFFKLNFDTDSENPDMNEGAKEGRVEALFIVEPNGKVKYVEILQHYTNAYDEEMINTLLKMPKWEPAMLGGNPVRSFVKYSYEINFYMR